MFLPITVLYLTQELGGSKLEVGTILASYMIMALSIRPFAGYILAKLQLKTILVFSFVIYILCFYGYILAPTLIIFALIRAIHGISFGLATVSLTGAVISTLPTKCRDKGLNYYSMVSNLAMASGPVTSVILFDRYKDFEMLFLLAMVMSILGLIFSYITRLKIYDITESKQPISLDRFILLKGLRAAFVIIIVALSFGMLTTYTTMYGKLEVITRFGSGIFFVDFAIGFALLRILTAGFIDRGHLRLISMLGMVTLLSSFTFFIFFKSDVAYYISAITMGGAYGMISPALQNMIISMSPNSKRATANATYYVSWDFGIGLGIFLGGAISEISNLTNAFIVSFFMLWIATIFLFLIVFPHYSRNKDINI